MSRADLSEFVTAEEVERIEKDPVLTVSDVVNHRKGADE